MAQSLSFAPSPIPFTNYPEEKNRRKKNQQIDRDQNRESDADHGRKLSEDASGGVTMSLPHSMIATAQLR
jgi:hypothetical protein